MKRKYLLLDSLDNLEELVPGCLTIFVLLSFQPHNNVLPASKKVKQ